MKVPVLDGRSHHQTPEEHHVRVGDVVAADVLGLLDAEDWEEDDGHEGGHGHRDTFGHPVDGHDDDTVRRVADLHKYQKR